MLNSLEDERGVTSGSNISETRNYFEFQIGGIGTQMGPRLLGTEHGKWRLHGVHVSQSQIQILRRQENR